MPTSSACWSHPACITLDDHGDDEDLRPCLATIVSRDLESRITKKRSLANPQTTKKVTSELRIQVETSGRCFEASCKHSGRFEGYRPDVTATKGFTAQNPANPISPLSFIDLGKPCINPKALNPETRNLKAVYSPKTPKHPRPITPKS